MDPQALADALAAERRPVMAVVATAGSTAVGAFDDLEAIADLCAERGIWLHVDGAHGASALLSPRHRQRVAGVGRADSLAWDPHKMLSLPLASGALLLRDERRLDAAFAQHAEYLFHDRSERVYDQGVRSFQCSRRGDALKLWVAWQRHGTEGLGALYDHLCETTAAFHARRRGAPRVRRAAPAGGQHPLLRPPRRPRRGAARGVERVRAAATSR